MQTPGVEADIFQIPQFGKNREANILPNVDLDFNCDSLQSNVIAYILIVFVWVCILVWWSLLN
jgi:hypothetical protein